MTAASARARLLVVAALGALGGCTLITDPGRFEVTGDGQRPPDACDGVRRSLIGTFTGFDDFDQERLEMFVVESTTGGAAERVVIEGMHPRHDLAGERFEVFAPCMVPGRSGYELRVYVDFDENGAYTPPSPGDEGDPAFVEPIDAEGRVAVDFDTSPRTDISENLDTGGRGSFTLVVTDMTPHTPGEQRQELHVIDVTEGDTAAARAVVGYHRIGDLDSPDYEVHLGGVIAVGRRYRVEFYADLTDDGRYDDPPADHAWQEPSGTLRETFVGLATGNTLRFSHRGTFDPLDTF